MNLNAAPTVNENVAKGIAALFGSDDDSDCVVAFCLEAEAAVRPAKRQRLGVGPTPTSHAPSATVGEPLPAHQLVLRFASERFAAELKRWAPEKAARASPDGGALSPAAPPDAASCSSPSSAPDRRPVLRVPLASEEELPSARAAIRFAYTGVVQADSIQEALEVRRQAQYLLMSGCATACVRIILDKLKASQGVAEASLANLVKTGKDDATVPPVLELYACADLWPDPHEEPGFAEVLQVARTLIVAQFHDTLLSLNLPSRRRQLLALPAQGIEALLGSEGFSTDTEDSVLLLLATWMRANYESTDAAAREQLCRLVRLAQLSPTYATAVLLPLAADYEARGLLAAPPVAPGPSGTAATPGPAAACGWFPIRVQEAAFIVSLVTAEAAVRAELQFAAAAAGMYQDTPTSRWYSTLPRPDASWGVGVCRVYLWSVKVPELAQAVSSIAAGNEVSVKIDADFDLHQAGLSHIVASGLEWSVKLEVGNRGAEAYLGLCCRLPDAYRLEGSRLGPGSDVVAAARLRGFLSTLRRLGSDIPSDTSDLNDLVWAVGTSTKGAYLKLAPREAEGGELSNAPMRPWTEYLNGEYIKGYALLNPPRLR